jgi:hypothetical protein
MSDVPASPTTGKPRQALVMAASSFGALFLLAGYWFFLDGLRLANSPLSDRERDAGTIHMHAFAFEAIGVGLGLMGLMVFLVLFLTRRRTVRAAAPKPSAPAES